MDEDQELAVVRARIKELEALLEELKHENRTLHNDLRIKKYLQEQLDNSEEAG